MCCNLQSTEVSRDAYVARVNIFIQMAALGKKEGVVTLFSIHSSPRLEWRRNLVVKLQLPAD